MARAKDEIALEIDGRAVVVTSPTRLLIPEAGDSKLDLVNFYLAVAEGGSARGGRAALRAAAMTVIPAQAGTQGVRARRRAGSFESGSPGFPPSRE
ncbi:MAG TPA: hypothetical protein VF522_24095 [Ramlibacter sp.]|uniref:hypothetical protein n=1 Tax=Ramlibacter sp. TaxID=1917967 RepID=UPI002ED07E25